MRRTKQEYLSPIQGGVLVLSSVIGTVVVTLPRLATQAAQHSGVLSVFLAGLISLVLSILAVQLGKRFSNQTIIEYSATIAGKIPGKLIGVLIIIYSITVVGTALRVFADTLKIFMLPKTPIEFIMVTMLIVIVYLIYKGIGAIAKISESFIPLVITVLLLVIVLNFQDFEIRNLRPLISNGLVRTIKGALQGIPKIITAFLGFEIAFFIIPFLQEPDKITPYVAGGILLPTIIYTALTAMSIGVFGIELTKKMLYPTISLARAIEFPGAFAERFDILFSILWILGVFTSISIFFYIASLSITRIMGLKNFRPFIFILVPFVYLVSILPQNIYQIHFLIDIVGYIGIVVTLLPIPLLLISKISGKGEKKHAKNS